MGYRWDPVVRIVPRNGAERVLVFADEFTDLAGHEKADVRYVPDSSQRRDVNRIERPRRFGWRPEVRFDLAIMTMADQHALAEIQDALMAEKVDVYLAMDSVTFRRVVLASDDGPDPLAGKPFVGAKFRLGVRCAELIHERPRMGETTNPFQRELIQDGGFEQWVSATDAQAWVEQISASNTINQDADAYSGSFAMRIDRGAAGSLWAYQSGILMQPGQKYTLSARSKYAAAANFIRMGVRNTSTLLEYDGSTDSWGAINKYAIDTTLTTSYALYQTTFRVPTNTRADHNYQVFLYASSVASIFYDEVSLLGPVLPTGVALW